MAFEDRYGRHGGPGQPCRRQSSEKLDKVLRFSYASHHRLLTTLGPLLDITRTLRHSVRKLTWAFPSSHMLTFGLAKVIRAALHPVSVPQASLSIGTLGGDAWRPAPGTLVSWGNNPYQNPDVNLSHASETRTVGGMGTHWTCACRTYHWVVSSA